MTGPYLGQDPPGITPEVFAPGIVSTEKDEINAVFSPDGNEFFFSVREDIYKIMHMRKIDNKWTEPEVFEYSGIYSEADPFISPDGSMLYFASKRPVEGFGPPHDIWMCKKTDSGWSYPFNPGTPLNTGANEIYPSVTEDNIVYFNSNRDGGYGGRDIYRTKYIDGVFSEPENLGGKISTEYDEGDVFVSPDETYLIFVSRDRPGSFGSGDLYICFRETDGSWSDPVNLGDKINTEHYDFCPVVSPDGKYFFYSSNGDVFWVSAGILEQFIK
ncbi:hypothetical protein ACFL6G_07380 [candidate division KSB1 bacterium]